MATTYTPNLKLAMPTPGDSSNVLQYWSGNAEVLDTLAPLFSLFVTTSEVPSQSLNVSVAPGSTPKSDGSRLIFPGVAAQEIPANSTSVLYLDDSGALQIATAYPVDVAYTPLATVTTGDTTITSIIDDRVRNGRILFSLGGYGNDNAAGNNGVPIGGLYHQGGIVHVRLT